MKTRQVEAGRKIGIGWGVTSDLPAILDIDAKAFADAWDEAELRKRVAVANTILLVARVNDRVVGYIVYELHRRRFNVLRLAVHPEFRRTGVGRAIIDRMIHRLSHKRPELALMVRETNLDAQLFLRDIGFKAVFVVRGHFEDTGEDAYEMAFRCTERAGLPVIATSRD